jgi:hypothetical protein
MVLRIKQSGVGDFWICLELLEKKLKVLKKEFFKLRRTRSVCMARPEGFEPPTPRSVVRSNPQQHVLAWNRSRVFQGVPAFHFMSVRLSTSHCGNIRGNNPGHESTSCRLAITSHISRDARVRSCTSRSRAKVTYPQILYLWASKIIIFSSSLPCPVSTMFPY